LADNATFDGSLGGCGLFLLRLEIHFTFCLTADGFDGQEEESSQVSSIAVREFQISSAIRSCIAERLPWQSKR